MSKTAEEATAADDIDSQALWRSIRAPIVARAGNYDTRPKTLARTAVELVRRTEAPGLQADALSELASVLRLSGQDSTRPRQIIGEAITLYTLQGQRRFGRPLQGVGCRLKHLNTRSLVMLSPLAHCETRGSLAGSSLRTRSKLPFLRLISVNSKSPFSAGVQPGYRFVLVVHCLGNARNAI